jgi:hypothetical protein
LRRDRDDWRHQYGLKCDQLRDLQEVNARLRADIASFHDRSRSPLRRKAARRHGTSPSPVRASSRQGSPMRVDRARGRSPPPSGPLAHSVETNYHAPGAPAHGAEGGLISRLSVVPHGSRTYHTQGAPTPNVEGGLLSRLSDAPPGAPDIITRGAAPFRPTPALPSMGFPALLPVVICQVTEEGRGTRLRPGSDSVQLGASGNIDFGAHGRYVFASGVVNNRPRGAGLRGRTR